MAEAGIRRIQGTAVGARLRLFTTRRTHPGLCNPSLAGPFRAGRQRQGRVVAIRLLERKGGVSELEDVAFPGGLARNLLPVDKGSVGAAKVFHRHARGCDRKTRVVAGDAPISGEHNLVG